jgi:hypothetical protein
VHSGLIEGSDKYVNENLRSVHAGLEECIQAGGVTDKAGVFISIDFLGGGDMAWSNEVGGSYCDFGSSVCDSQNCIWCEVKKKDLKRLPGEEIRRKLIHKTTKVESFTTHTYVSPEQRTLERQCWYAHLPVPDPVAQRMGKTQFPFTCPGCKLEFRSNKVKQMRLLY